jgi:hypothetical protein
MRRARRGIPNLDLVASTGVGSYRRTAPFVPVFIGDTNLVAYIVAAVLRESPRNPGGVSFRSLQVSEIPPVTEHLGLRLQRERFQRFGVGFNAQVCTFNVRNLLALGI